MRHLPRAADRGGATSLTEHPPFESGDCLVCHQPHASSQAALLTAPTGEVCGQCHDQPVTPPPGGSAHPPAAAGDCTACHQPHAAANQPFLRAPLRTLCTTCHADVGEQLASENVHQPAAEPDGCVTCHQPHMSRNADLLSSAGRRDLPALP